MESAAFDGTDAVLSRDSFDKAISLFITNGEETEDFND
jgi:hypothetical protein